MIDRRIFVASLSVSPIALAKDDFWNSRKPEEWTEKEIQQLLTKSPWTREATAEFSMGGGMGPGGGMGGGRMGGGMGGPGGGMGGPGGGMGGPGGGMGGPGGGMGGPGGGMGGPGGGMGGPGGDMGGMQRPSVKAQIRWESALPIRLASKRNTAAPDGYVISVSGLPMMGGGMMGGGMRGGMPGGMGGGMPGGMPGGGPGGIPQGGQRPNPPSQEEMEQRRQMMIDRVKDATRIERKGKDPIAPEQVQMSQPGGANIILFAFPKTGQPIVAADKEITFVTALGPMSLKAKFSLKEMMYQGQLEL